MAVSYVGVSSGDSDIGTRTTFDTTFPAGWAAGDVAVLFGHVSATNLTMDAGAGWSAVPGSWPVNQSTNSRAYAWFRVLQSGDTAPTITNSGAITGGWEMVVLRDASTVAQAGSATASSTSVALPTLTGVLAGSALVASVHVRVATGTIPTNLTPNAAYTEVVDHATSRATSSANLRMDAAYRLISSVGSYGGESVTSTTTGSMIGVLVEVTAASVDATVSPDGLSVSASVGSPSVDGALATAPVGQSVPATVGSPTALDGSLAVAPGGVTLPVALGSPDASWGLSAAPDGVPVAAAVGGPSVGWAAAVAPEGLSAAVEVGDPSLLGVVPSPDGVAVPLAVGDPSAVWTAELIPDGLLVLLEVGDPTAAGEAIVPDGLLVLVELGDPEATWAADVLPDGVPVPVAVGSPSTALPGQGVPRPALTSVARPAVAPVSRPAAAAVARPSL